MSDFFFAERHGRSLPCSDRFFFIAVADPSLAPAYGIQFKWCRWIKKRATSEGTSDVRSEGVKRSEGERQRHAAPPGGRGSGGGGNQNFCQQAGCFFLVNES